MEEKKKTEDNIPLSAKTDMEAYIRSAGHGGTGAAMPQGIGNRYFMLWIIVAFFAGMLVTLCIISLEGGEKNTGQNSSAEVVVNYLNTVDEDTEQASDFFKRANDILDNQKVTFDQIETVYSEYIDIQPKLSQSTVQANSDNIARLSLYHKIAKAFEKADNASIDFLVACASNDLDKEPNVKLLYSEHYAKLHYLLWVLVESGKEYPLRPSERTRATEYLQTHAHQYKSFYELPSYSYIFPSADKSNYRDKEKQNYREQKKQNDKKKPKSNNVDKRTMER